MQFYAVCKEVITSADLETFTHIAAILRELPDLVFDPDERHWGECKNQVSCHLLCRAFADHFAVTVRDGYFMRSYRHSWLVPAGRSSIIDAYPVGGASPFIVATDRWSPWAQMYHQDAGIGKDCKSPKFLYRLELTKQAVAETIRRLGIPTVKSS